MAFEQFMKGELVELVESYAGHPVGARGVVSYSEGASESHLTTVQMDRPNKHGNSRIVAYNRRLKKQVHVPMLNTLNAITMVSQAADRIFPRRTYDTILKSLMEEVGELATEIAIEQGTKDRAPSVDGVKGEAVDVFIVAVDMLRNAFGDKLHGPEFSEYVRRKLAKWEGK